MQKPVPTTSRGRYPKYPSPHRGLTFQYQRPVEVTKASITDMILYKSFIIFFFFSLISSILFLRMLLPYRSLLNINFSIQDQAMRGRHFQLEILPLAMLFYALFLPITNIAPAAPRRTTAPAAYTPQVESTPVLGAIPVPVVSVPAALDSSISAITATGDRS